MLKRTIFSVALASGVVADELSDIFSEHPYLLTYYSSVYGTGWEKSIQDYNSGDYAALLSQYGAYTDYSVGDYSYDTSSFLSYYGSVYGVSFSDYNAFLTFGENLDVTSYLSHLSQEFSADPAAYSSAVAAFQSDATLSGAATADSASASSGAGGTGSNSIAASTTSGSETGSDTGSTTKASGSSASTSGSKSGSSSESGGSASGSSTSSKAGVYSVGVPVVGLFAALALVL